MQESQILVINRGKYGHFTSFVNRSLNSQNDLYFGMEGVVACIVIICCGSFCLLAFFFGFVSFWHNIILVLFPSGYLPFLVKKKGILGFPMIQTRPMSNRIHTQQISLTHLGMPEYLKAYKALKYFKAPIILVFLLQFCRIRVLAL